jgi:hypothetical protein
VVTLEAFSDSLRVSAELPLVRLPALGFQVRIQLLQLFTTEVLGSERLTGALLDRLTHHVHILEMKGDSYRLKQSRRRREPAAQR